MAESLSKVERVMFLQGLVKEILERVTAAGSVGYPLAELRTMHLAVGTKDQLIDGGGLVQRIPATLMDRIERQLVVDGLVTVSGERMFFVPQGARAVGNRWAHLAGGIMTPAVKS
jgi:hypothetical protein